MEQHLLDILACPLCKGKLIEDDTGANVICRFDRMAFPVCDGIPVMLVDQATPIEEE